MGTKVKRRMRFCLSLGNALPMAPFHCDRFAILIAIRCRVLAVWMRDGFSACIETEKLTNETKGIRSLVTPRKRTRWLGLVRFWVRNCSSPMSCMDRHQVWPNRRDRGARFKTNWTFKRIEPSLGMRWILITDWEAVFRICQRIMSVCRAWFLMQIQKSVQRNNPNNTTDWYELTHMLTWIHDSR